MSLISMESAQVKILVMVEIKTTKKHNYSKSITSELNWFNSNIIYNSFFPKRFNKQEKNEINTILKAFYFVLHTPKVEKKQQATD